MIQQQVRQRPHQLQPQHLFQQFLQHRSQLILLLLPQLLPLQLPLLPGFPLPLQRRNQRFLQLLHHLNQQVIQRHSQVFVPQLNHQTNHHRCQVDSPLKSHQPNHPINLPYNQQPILPRNLQDSQRDNHPVSPLLNQPANHHPHQPATQVFNPLNSPQCSHPPILPQDRPVSHH